MFCNILLIVGIVCAASVAASKESTPIEVSTRYITTKVYTLSTGQSLTFIATLCQQFIGATVNATALLNNNPSWNPDLGTLIYYIVDDPNKVENEALCNNTNGSGAQVSSCIVTKWPSVKDLFMKIKANAVAATSFTLDLEFSKPKKNPHGKHGMKSPKAYETSPNNGEYEYLTEIVTVRASQRLVYKEEAQLEVTFCPNNDTTKAYEITSSVYGTDDISSYTQYVCEKYPCTVADSLPQSNGNQLPNNNVFLTTASAQYAHLYVLIVCWAGALDPAIPNYVGEFQYSGSIERM